MSINHDLLAMPPCTSMNVICKHLAVLSQVNTVLLRQFAELIIALSLFHNLTDPTITLELDLPPQLQLECFFCFLHLH